MKEEIKVLEEMVELNKSKLVEYKSTGVWYNEDTEIYTNCIENLIKGYRELEEFVEAIEEIQKTKTPIVELVHEMNKFEDEFIPKSKVKEKIEKYKKLGDEFYEKFLETNKTDIDIHDAGISCDAKVQVLQELMEDK